MRPIYCFHFKQNNSKEPLFWIEFFIRSIFVNWSKLLAKKVHYRA